jgi:transposase InsO family protein
MDQRLELVREYETELFTMTELATHYGISRKTAYKWLERYQADGALGLLERSRRPHTSPTKTPDEVIERLVTCRQRHPRWGPKKLLRYMKRRHPGRSGQWPAESTLARYLHTKGVTQQRPGSRRTWIQETTRVRHPSDGPNTIWTADFKGQFRIGNGRWCYPLTVMDTYSRYLLGCHGCEGPTDSESRATFQRLFEEYGLPAVMCTDNGTPFASTGVGGLTPLSVWWIRLGIVLDRIRRGHPEDNGRHERMHRTLKAETARPPAGTAHAQQQRFEAFRREYNDERPHEALDFEVPASRYVPSARPYPSRLSPLEYPGHFDVRRVYPHGDIRLRGRRLFLSESLRGEYVGLEEVEDGVWDICFASVRLARLDRRTWSLHPRPEDRRVRS